MEQFQLKVNIRQDTGKQRAKKLRGEGWVPGIVYHRGEQPIAIAVGEKDISRILHNAGNENVLINLTIEKDKKKSRPVIVKEIQHDPVKRSILHVDFNEISLTEIITVEVEIVPVGEAIGVRQEGGVLDHPLRELKIQCLPTDIPKHIEVDVSGLKLNDTIHARDLHLSEKVKVLTDPDAVLFAVKQHVEEKVEEAAAPQEVEVLREKKEEEVKPGEKAKEEPQAKEAAKPEKK